MQVQVAPCAAVHVHLLVVSVSALLNPNFPSGCCGVVGQVSGGVFSASVRPSLPETSGLDAFATSGVPLLSAVRSVGDPESGIGEPVETTRNPETDVQGRQILGAELADTTFTETSPQHRLPAGEYGQDGSYSV